MISKKYKNKIFYFTFLLTLILFPLKFVFATASEDIASFLSWVFLLLASAIGSLTTLIIEQVNKVFLITGDAMNVSAVDKGWIIMRDISNMFFVLILLVIAFATILRIENYSMKRNLPKLLIMAVLINFSKTICWLLIDISQIFMLTFANGFAGNGANFVSALQLDKLWAISGADNLSLNSWSVFGSIILIIIIVIISFFITLMMAGFLLMRIIMFWILIILSPLAFLSYAIPGSSVFSKWWGQFSKYLIAGPILAFFVWLSLSVAIDSSPLTSINTTSSEEELRVALNAISTPSNMLNYMVVIGLLIVAMKLSTSAGAAGGGFGMGLANSFKNKGVNMGKRVGMAPLKGARSAALGLGGYGVDLVSQKAGIDLNVTRGYKRFMKQREDNKRARETSIYAKTLTTARGDDEKKPSGWIRSKLALASTGDVAWQNIATLDKETWKRNFRRPKSVKKYRENLKVAQDERNNVLSDSEYTALDEKAKAGATRRAKLNTLIQEQKNIETSADPKVTKEDKEKAKKMRVDYEEDRNALDTELNSIQNELTTKDHDEEKAKILDSRIKENKDAIGGYRIRGITTASIDANNQLESIESKKVSGIDNADELGMILKEAIKDGNQGLIAAVSKRMTQKGDYNEMLGQLGLGTGRAGMLGFARILQDNAKMTHQDSLGLISELGGICKNIGHFAGYGATRMENGKWREATEKESQSAQLSEMLKMQPQEFARKVSRLGLGQYVSGEQTPENWRLNESALMYAKLMGARLGKQYRETGQQNAIEFWKLAMEEVKSNNVSEEFIRDIEGASKVARGSGVKADEMVVSAKVKREKVVDDYKGKDGEELNI